MANLTRRALLASLPVWSAMGLTVPAVAQSIGRDSFAGEDPAETLNTMIRVMGRTDGGIGIRWTHGVLAGIVDKKTRQILGVSQQIFSRHRRNDDGSFDASYLEFVYWTDLETGAVLEQWNNPYTGRKVDVPVQVLGPTKFHIPLNLKVVNEPYPMEGIINSHWLEPLPHHGGDIAFNERIDSYVPPMTEGGAPLEFHEVFAFRAPRAALKKAEQTHIEATVDKVNVISWRPWMDMNDVDGVTMSRGAGRVIADYADLPADLAAQNQTHFPDVVDELEDYLTL